MKPTLNYGLSDSLIDAVRKAVEEALVGGQKKLDVDKDGKLEKTDFASLRAKKNTIDTKPKLKEEEEINEDPSDGGGSDIRHHYNPKGEKPKLGKSGTHVLETGKGKYKVLQAPSSNRLNYGKPVKRGSEITNAHLSDHYEYGRGVVHVHTHNPEEAMMSHSDARKHFGEEVDQIDELSVNKMLKYTDAANKNREVLNKKWDTGTATEREKNKVLGHEMGVDRAAARVKAKTGKNPNEIGKLSRMKYAVTKEEEQMDEAPMKSGAQSRREVDSFMDQYGLGSKQKEAPKSNIRKVVGKSYGADYKDPEGEDETAADMKKAEPKRKSGPQGTMARRFNTKSYDKIKGKLKAQY